MSTWLQFFFVSPYGWSTTAYVAMQLIAIVRTSGWMRAVCFLPLPVMTVLLIQSLQAYRAGSNLWPILVLFCSPVALLFVTITWLVAERRRPQAPREHHG